MSGRQYSTAAIKCFLCLSCFDNFLFSQRIRQKEQVVINLRKSSKSWLNIPSSEDSWPVACRLLKRTTGGLLHIHNVTSALPNTAINDASGKKSDREAWQVWADDTAKHITFLLKDITGAQWTTSIQHIEHVKSYVPHVHHVVLDLACRPSWAEGMNTETLLYSSLHKHYTNSSLYPKPLNPPRCNWPC